MVMLYVLLFFECVHDMLLSDDITVAKQGSTGNKLQKCYQRLYNVVPPIVLTFQF
jgi:hypothetical protein